MQLALYSEQGTDVETFGEWLYEEVLKQVPHRQWVFSIPKRQDGSTTKTFLALDWLAHLITHIPNKGEQMARYYGYYSNKARGLRKKTDTAELVPALIDTDISKKEFRRNWSRLIQKVYHADPLVCPKCSGNMRIISFIEDASVIKDILLHLDLWVVRNHGPPLGKAAKRYLPESVEIPEEPQFSDEVQFFMMVMIVTSSLRMTTLK